MKKGLLLIGGLILALVIFVSAAQAAVVTVSTSPSNVPPNPILNSTGANLATGAYVQVILSTDSSVSVPSQTTGLPTSGTDTVVATGTLSAPGTFTRSGVSIPTGNYVYIVAWETWNGTGTPTGNYGISAISPQMVVVSYPYRPASFRTDDPVIPPPVPGALQFSAATYSVVENVATATITATRTGGSSGAVGVSYATSNGTATAGSDYTAASGTLSWADGDTASKTFTVAIINDAVVEPNETVTLTLSAPTGGATLGPTNPATLTITNDDVPPPAGALQFSAATYTMAEGGGTATITVTRTGGSSGAVGVSYASSNGTATAGTDYTAASGTLSWVDGDTASKTFTVTILNDSVAETDETVNLTLSAPTGGAALGSPNPATLTITDDDTAPPTSVVIDDYEGGSVNPATGYYNAGFAGAGTPVPTMTRVTGAANLHEGTYGMNTVYAAGAASPNDWRGWGGTLISAKDISATNTISFWMKGDGSANKVKIQFKDADGSNYGVTDADAVALTDTTWREYKIPISRLTNQIAAGTAAGLDPANITEYQFVFSGTAASTGVLIDYVMAITEGVSTDPQIISISPTSGPGGTQVTIRGSNLDTAGVVQFATEGGVITSVNSAATDTLITAWSPSGDSITMRIPSMTNGSKNVKVVRASDLRESNTVTFEVTGATATDSLTNAYPNPFNPLGGEVTRIVFSPGSATRADILIFDMTAKLVSKLNWPTTGTIRPDGRVEVVWDGKNSYGEIVGDGVYLYRVVDGGVRKGKILVVNKK